MKAKYVVAEDAKDFLRVYDEYLFVTCSLSLEEAKFAKKRLRKKKAKIYKLMEVKNV